MSDHRDPKDVAPATGSRDRLLQLVRAPRPPIRADDYAWTEEAPGVRTTVLFEDPRAGIRHGLIWLQAGALLPRHIHFGTEDVLVLSGRLRLRGENQGNYGPGSVLRSRLGTEHEGTAAHGQDCFSFTVTYYEPLIE